MKKTGGYACPMITPDGNRIVYTDSRTRAAMVVGWDGKNRRILARQAYAVCVWKDPDTGREWAFVRPNNSKSWFSKSRPVVGFPIDNPKKKSLLEPYPRKLGMICRPTARARRGAHPGPIAAWQRCPTAG